MTLCSWNEMAVERNDRKPLWVALPTREDLLMTGDPSRAKSVWLETCLTLVERTSSICELPDPVSQF